MPKSHIQFGTITGEANPATYEVALCHSAMNLQETEVLPAGLEIKPIQSHVEIRLTEEITDA